jgi:hypothetical protein
VRVEARCSDVQVARGEVWECIATAPTEEGRDFREQSR